MPFNSKVSTSKKEENLSSLNKSSNIQLMGAAHPEAIIQRVRGNPQSLTHSDTIVLQRTIGNQAVCQLMKEMGIVNTKPVQKKENATGLPDGLKAGVESMSGLSMDSVRVHYNSSKPAQVGALAYTQGADIHVAPGQERHLPHETWHVVQQAEGRVKPTLQMKGVRVNDDVGLEREADVMGDLAVKYPQDNSHAQLKSSNSRSTIIQCKGDKPLMDQLEDKDLKKWMEHNLASLLEKIRYYDNLNSGPEAQEEVIKGILKELKKNSQLKKEENYSALRKILKDERNITNNQAKRLKRYTSDPSDPYRQMTEEGMLWSQEYFEHNIRKLRKKGKSYFEKLSKMNIKSIQRDIPQKVEGWYTEFVAAAEEELKKAVVSHYTAREKADTMARPDEKLKSKTMLEKNFSTFENNTQSVDQFGLGNSGFIFFFIEAPGAQSRGSRFGDTRISIPIQESGLLTNGWIMLADFTQREYPTIRAKGDGEHKSFLRTQYGLDELEKIEKDYPIPVREFEDGTDKITTEKLDEIDKKTYKIEKQEEQSAYGVVARLALLDKVSTQTYGDSDKELQIPERFYNNVLVGKDIIPGLANRAGLEVRRINEVNPTVGKKFSELRGNALMLFILKDLFRPQAMIPNSFNIKKKHIQ